MEELDTMRRQLADMKQRLDTQQIVNHDLLQKVMRGRVSWLNSLVKAEFIMLPIAYLIFVDICYGCGISQWYAFSFLVLGGIDALFDMRTVRIPAALFGKLSVVSLREFLIRQKKERFIQTCVSGSLAVVWFLLFGYAIAMSTVIASADSDAMQAAGIGGIAGGIVGVVVAVIVVVVLYRKMQATNDAILSDLSDLTQE